MAAFSLTPSQQAAVDAPIMDLLVSAAAGSGKTAVLTRRLLRLISDPDSACDLSRMLIVTFTKAAASELRVKIGKELRAALLALEEIPEEDRDGDFDRRVEKIKSSLDKLESAEISTIHSFCYTLVRKHFSELGLSCSLRIGDEAECTLMKHRVMEETIDALYEKDPEFLYFADNLVALQDAGLANTLIEFYDKIISLSQGISHVAQSANDLRAAAENFDTSVFVKHLLTRFGRFFAYYKLAYEKALVAIREDEKGVKNYLPTFAEDYRFICDWEKTRSLSYFEITKCLNDFTFGKCGVYRGEKPAGIEYAKIIRDEFKKEFALLRKTYCVYSQEEIRRDALETAHHAGMLYETLKLFDERYAEEKKRYGILDYNDLERFTYRLLTENGESTPLARSVAQQYDAIFIDEYQDTNDVQDAIFASVSRYNRFMVGDIKQSIYSFRGAMPEIFSQYRESFPDYLPGANQKQAKIFLSENFRSDKSVIDYCNSVFAKLFRFNSGRVPYLEEDALLCSRDPSGDAHLPVRFLMVEKNAKKDGLPPSEELSMDMAADEVDFDEEEEQLPADNLTEEEVAAQEIYHLIHDEKVKPENIVILLRNMTHAEKYRKALSALTVSCQSAKKSDSLFTYPEILLLISLLNVMDNPNRDIYLAAVLKSPIFGLDLTELIRLRKAFPESSLYGSVTSLLEAEVIPEGFDAIKGKLAAFKEFLEKARCFAELRSSEKVVRYLFSVTPIRAIAAKAGSNGRTFAAFYDFARSFEKNGFRGVHAFCRHIREIEEDTRILPPALQPAADLDSVRIMTIHQSKGLEFDYVFLADTAHAFYKWDLSADVVYEKTLGLGLKLRERDGFVHFDTLIRKTVAGQLGENLFDEEMRVLYVAMTRAKKQLIVTCAKGNVKNPGCYKYLEKAFRRADLVTPHLYMAESDCYADWLTLTTDQSIIRVVESLSQTEVSKEAAAPEEEDVLISPEVLEGRLDYEYPHAILAALPTKLSVSRLEPDILDDEAEELLRSERADFDRVPLFMQEQAQKSGAERGTATHLFMQFCDFDQLLQNGVDAEIERLVESAFITEDIAKLILRDKLECFVKSPLFARIQSAKIVHREERFNVLLSAAEFTRDPEKIKAFEKESILVQGVVDCLLEEEDGTFVLIDYKTDRTPKDRAAAEQMLKERYTTQLSYYKRAVEKVFSAKVKETLIYSFGLGDTVVI